MVDSRELGRGQRAHHRHFGAADLRAAVRRGRDDPARQRTHLGARVRRRAPDPVRRGQDREHGLPVRPLLHRATPTTCEKGPPPIVLRLLGPVVTVTDGRGARDRHRRGARAASRTGSCTRTRRFILWFGAMTLHVLGHALETPALAIADLRDARRRTGRLPRAEPGSRLVGLAARGRHPARDRVARLGPPLAAPQRALTAADGRDRVGQSRRGRAKRLSERPTTIAAIASVELTPKHGLELGDDALHRPVGEEQLLCSANRGQLTSHADSSTGLPGSPAIRPISVARFRRLASASRPVTIYRNTSTHVGTVAGDRSATGRRRVEESDKEKHMRDFREQSRGHRGHRHDGEGWEGRRRGGRMRRGDIRTAVLAILAEEPGHGYDVIQRLEEKTSGAWRPSPGFGLPDLAAARGRRPPALRRARRQAGLRDHRRRAAKRRPVASRRRAELRGRSPAATTPASASSATRSANSSSPSKQVIAPGNRATGRAHGRDPEAGAQGHLHDAGRGLNAARRGLKL